MDQNLLQSFLQVAELGNMSRAAERLHLSQPALSRQIRQLENSLGVPLFERTGRGVRLTRAGEFLEVRARPLVAQLEQLASDVAARAAEVSGPLRFAVPPAFGADRIADLIEAYQSRYPRVRVQVRVALSGTIHEDLRRGALDLGVLYSPIRSRALATEPLWTEHLCAIGAPDLLMDPDPHAFADVLEHPVLLPSSTHGLRILVEAHAARLGATIDVHTEVDALRFLVELVRRGRGVTFLPRRTVQAEVDQGTLRAVDLRDEPLERDTLLAWTTDRPRSQATQAMMELMRDTLTP